MIAAGCHDELAEFLLVGKAVLLTLECAHKDGVAGQELLLISEGHDTVVLEGLLSVSNLGRLVRGHALGHISFRGEEHVVSELLRVGNEDLSLFLVGEVEEEVLVEDSKLGRVSASDKPLLVLPGYWAVVCELRDALLEEDTIHVKVLNAASPLATSLVLMLEVACEFHAGLQILADSLDSSVLGEPLGFHGIYSCDIVVEFLEEVDDAGQICLSIL